jgi:hypothetical protein
MPPASGAGPCSPIRKGVTAAVAFISGRANHRISDKPPADYIPPLIEANGEQPFISQCIPTDPALLRLERYRDFLAERRQRIAESLNTFLANHSALL